MATLNEIIEALRATSSNKEKLAILQNHKTFTELKEFLWATYEPTVNYYVTVKALKDAGFGVNPTDTKIAFDTALINEILDNVASRLVSGNEAKQWLVKVGSMMSEPHRALLLMMIDRDIRAGISASTINKVWPGLITDPPYMRMSLPKETKLDEYDWKQGVFSQRKADGMFCAVEHHESGEVVIRTRAGRPLPCDQFLSLVNEIKMVVPVGQQAHGELNVLELLTDDPIPTRRLLPREASNGIMNSLLAGGEFPQGHLVELSLWDMLPIAEAKPKGKFPVPYKTRFGILRVKYIDAERDGMLSHLSLIETQTVYSIGEAMAHYERIIEEGGEGTILKDPNGIWEDTTSKCCCKLKLEFEVDLKVVGFNSGKGKNAATFGSIACESSCGQFKVNVSGFKDAQRKSIWENHEQLVGTIVAVKGNSLMSPRVGKPYWSMFLPVYVESRAGEKTEADSLVRIQSIFANALKKT